MCQSLVVTMALVIAVFATALVAVTYPWDVLAIHSVSLRHMLLAIAPVALLSVATILFLASVYREARLAEARPRAADREEAFDLVALLGRAGAAPLPPADGRSLPRAWGDASLALVALAALVSPRPTDSPPEVAVRAEGKAVVAELRASEGPGLSPGALAAAVDALERSGAEVGLDGPRIAVAFPAAAY